MSREIKFRGRHVETGEWVYGCYNYLKLPFGEQVEHFIVVDGFKALTVDPETVGQLTGLKDGEDTEIYEGDQLYAKGNLTDDLQYVGDVVWDEEDARWEVENFHGRYEYIPNGVYVRGNIYQPAELIGRTAIESNE